MIVALLTVGLGCQPRPELVTLYDLVGEFPVAEVSREEPLIDIGTEAARPHLVDGWSWDEARRDGTTFVWAAGERSELEFFVGNPRPMTAYFRCRPFSYPGAPPQSVRASLNGEPIGVIELIRGTHDYELALPAKSLTGGVNRLEVRYAYSRRVSEVASSQDHRSLAVAWESMSFEDVSSPGAAERRENPPAVFVPFGVELGFFLDLPEGCRVEFGQVDSSASLEGALEVWWRVDGESPQRLASLPTGNEPTAIEIPAGFPGPTRIGLRAVGGDRGEGAGMTGVRPIISGTKPPVSIEPGGTARLTEVPGGQTPPNVLIYVVDTLRADRLGCYGHTAAVSPNIDAFASEAVLYERVVAQSSWTKPSVVTILTGQGPLQHGVNGRMDRMPEELISLAELLDAGGFVTAGFVANAYITEKAGFARGFGEFDFAHGRSDAVTAKVMDWIGRYDDSRPFFLYVHTIDPHAPYEPSEPFRTEFASQVIDPAVGTHDHIRAIARKELPVNDSLVADMLALYDAEVAENDHAFGRLMEALKNRGLFDDTLIIFLSDHGEEFDEHGVFGHGWDLYGEVIDVPMIIKPPEHFGPHRVREVTQHVDVVPTVLAAVGFDVPKGVDGIDLLSGNAVARAAVSYMDYEGREGIAVTLGVWKVIEPLSKGFTEGPELFQRFDDRGEMINLVGEAPVRTGYLRSIAERNLLRRATGTASEEMATVDDETRRALQALGYLE
jgi:arylsulfatase A-like enzyme